MRRVDQPDPVTNPEIGFVGNLKLMFWAGIASVVYFWKRVLKFFMSTFMFWFFVLWIIDVIGVTDALYKTLDNI